MHTDYAVHPGHDVIVSAAVSRGVSVISAEQLLTWLDARNASRFTGSTWNGSILNVHFDTAANQPSVMFPTWFGAKSVKSVTRNGTGASTTVRVVNGVSYSVVDQASSGDYTVTYG